MTANQIATIFKDAVCWNRIEAGKIQSYAQVLRTGDDFYALNDRDAFSALLDDYFSQDNQLQDIFMDLYDAGLGFQKFSDAGQRASAKQIVAFFLNLPKYAYHKSDVAKVYLAVNSWLVFFGAAQIKPSWDFCPFCGASVVSDVCTSKSCKKTTADCLTVMAELDELLIKEKDGVKTKKPPYWDAIKPGKEFDSQFKVKLNQFYSQREQEKQREIERKNQEKIATGEAALSVLDHKVDLELKKKEPAYDLLLSQIAESTEVTEASKCKNKAFEAKVKALTGKILSHRQNLEFLEKKRIKRKKRTMCAILCSVAAFILLLTGGGVFYFGYWRPLNTYPFLTAELTAEECEVTGLKNENTSVLRMGEESANGWFVKTYSVVSVADGAFQGNTNLKKAYLPASVRQIGSSAFSGCTALNAVHLTSRTPPEITKSTFRNVPAHFFVPQESYSAYLSASCWQDMAENIFPDFENEDGYGCIVFDSNGGAGVADVRTHALGTLAPVLPQPQWNGYHFAGWYTADGTLVSSGKTVVESDMKLIAHWSAEAYSIRYETNGGTLSEDHPENYTIETGALLPPAKKKGYVFGGWYNNSALSGKSIDSIEIGSTGDIQLYARWTPNSYTIRFQTYGGSAFDPITVNTEEKVMLPFPAAPATGIYSNGYMFAGWALTENESAANGNSANLLNWIKENEEYVVPAFEENGHEIVLYAVWETTPMEWFSFDMLNGKLYLTGLTAAWEEYNGILDKTILYLPKQYGAADLYGIEGGAFENVANLRTVSIPDSVIVIGEGAFRGCKSLRAVLAAENVEIVGTDAFADTLWIDLFDENSWFRTIGKVLLRYGFLGGLQITEKNFPERVTVIAAGVFKDSSSLTEGKEDKDYHLYIPSRIKRIGDEAFANSYFTIVEWNAPSVQLGKSIFRGCNLAEMRISAAYLNLGAMFSAEDENYVDTIIYTGAATELNWIGSNVSVGTFVTTDQAVGNLKTVSIQEFNEIQFVYLSSLQLTSVNFSVYGKVTRLLLHGNNFGENLYVKADTIDELNAQSCQLTKVGVTSYGSYKGFVAKRIGTLDLYNNKITSLDLDQVESIGTLNMSNNSGMVSFNVATVHATKLILTNSSIQELLSRKNNQDVVNEDVKILFMPSELTKTYRLTYARFDLMPNLISLDIANNAIEITSYIVKLDKLQELYLGGNPVLKSSSEMTRLLSASFLPNLTRLNLGGGESSATASTILDIVKKCTGLTWLELYAIGTSTAQIAGAIKQSTHSKLVYLKISHNGSTVVPDSLKYIQVVVADYQ